jgi:REP element-mobilizing transposase RayT
MRRVHDDLPRLPPEFYCGEAYVHWTLTMEDRRTGWLIPVFYYKLREILAHAAFRYEFCCPIFCLMPDHMHLLWRGLSQTADQRKAMKFFRAQVNPLLERLGARFQKQPFDHVLRNDERQEQAFIALADYIARNPERKGLVPMDGYRDYPFTSCLVPGYPDLKPFDSGYWERFWGIESLLRRQGVRANADADST